MPAPHGLDSTATRGGALALTAGPPHPRSLNYRAGRGGSPLGIDSDCRRPSGHSAVRNTSASRLAGGSVASRRRPVRPVPGRGRPVGEGRPRAVRPCW